MAQAPLETKTPLGCMDSHDTIFKSTDDTQIPKSLPSKNQNNRDSQLNLYMSKSNPILCFRSLTQKTDNPLKPKLNFSNFLSSTNIKKTFDSYWSSKNFSLPKPIYNWYINEFCNCILREATSQSIASISKFDVITLRFQASTVKFAALPAASIPLAIAAQRLQDDCDFYLEISSSKDSSTKNYPTPSQSDVIGSCLHDEELIKSRIKKSYFEFINECSLLLKESQTYLSKITNEGDSNFLINLDSPKYREHNLYSKGHITSNFRPNNDLSKPNSPSSYFFSKVLKSLNFSHLLDSFNLFDKIFQKSTQHVNKQQSISPEISPLDTTRSIKHQIKKDQVIPFSSPIIENSINTNYNLHISKTSCRLYNERFHQSESSSLSEQKSTVTCNNFSNSASRYFDFVYKGTYYSSLALFILSAWFLPFLIIPSSLLLFLIYHFFRYSYIEFQNRFKRFSLNTLFRKEISLQRIYISILEFFYTLQTLHEEHLNQNYNFTSAQNQIEIENSRSNYSNQPLRLILFYLNYFLKFIIDTLLYSFAYLNFNNGPNASENKPFSPEILIENLTNEETNATGKLHSPTQPIVIKNEHPTLFHSSKNHVLNFFSPPEHLFTRTTIVSDDLLPTPNSRSLWSKKHSSRLSSQQYLSTSHMKRSRGYENLQFYDPRNRRSLSSHAF